MYSVNDLPAVSRKDYVGCSVEGGGSASRGSRFSNVVPALSRPRYNWHIGVHTIRLHDVVFMHRLSGSLLWDSKSISKLLGVQ